MRVRLRQQRGGHRLVEGRAEETKERFRKATDSQEGGDGRDRIGSNLPLTRTSRN